MLRSALLAVAFAPFLIPANYTQCVPVDNGPIIKQAPPLPFVRKPDFAAMTAYPRTTIFDGMPPPRFRAPATMTLETGSVAKCGVAGPKYFFEACVNGTLVHMPNPCDYGDREEFARLLCHEQAHINELARGSRRMSTVLITLATIGGLIVGGVVLISLAWRIMKSMYSTTGED